MAAASVLLIVLLVQGGVSEPEERDGAFDFDDVDDFLDDFMKAGSWNDMMEMGIPGPYNIKEGLEDDNEDSAADKELMFEMDVNDTKCALTPNIEKCNCGIRIGRRIVGGYAAKVNEHPWIVGLYRKEEKTPFCGGTLIGDEWVLTAAHCVYNRKSTSDIWISLGDYRVKNRDEGEMKIEIDEIITRNFAYGTGHQDIALIRLNTTVELGRSIYPACLPTAFDECVWTGENVTVAGWGQLAEKNFSQPNYLQVNNLPVVSWKYCRSKYYRLGWDNICTYKISKDTCKGDSGGPVLVEQDGRHYVIGVVSWGKGCARKGKPGVSVNVAAYLDWIEAVTGNSTCIQ